MIPGAGLYVIVRNVRFRWLADTQMPGNFPMAEFGAEDASVSVCFRPKADTQRPENCQIAGSENLGPRMRPRVSAFGQKRTFANLFADVRMPHCDRITSESAR